MHFSLNSALPHGATKIILVKDANPVAVNQETPKLSIALNGIVLTSNDETSFVLINGGNEQKRYSLNEALESAPGTFIRK